MKLCALACAVVAALAIVSPTGAHQFRFSAPLSGADEAIANNSPAVGSALVTLDEDEITMRVQASFSDLVGEVTSANIYAVTGQRLAGTGIPVVQDSSTDPPTTSLPDFPIGDFSGEYERTINLALESSYDPTFVATYGGADFDRVSKALNALIAGLNAGEAYLNITTTAFPGGEIRGFPIYVPGDFNNNGVVDAADYTVWRDTLGQTGEGLNADFDNSNSIDAIDCEMGWKANFGRNRFTVGPGSGGGAAVPEPTSPILIGIACGVLLLNCRRR